MADRRFPPPWRADKITEGYIVRDANGQVVAPARGTAVRWGMPATVLNRGSLVAVNHCYVLRSMQTAETFILAITACASTANFAF
jgi:hypothetical protein